MLSIGLEALIPYNADEDIDFEYYENKYSVKIPNSYKQFLCLYKTGKNSLKHELLLIEKDFFVPLVSYHHEDKEGDYVCLMDFFSLEDSLCFRSSDIDIIQENHLGLMRIMPISDVGGGGIYLGMNKDNEGKIYKLSYMMSEPIFLATDIFEFVRGIKSIFNSGMGIKPEQLYKNWGEDFWRIREDKSE